MIPKPCRQHSRRGRQGSVAIIVALSITVLLMFAALAIDFTYLVAERTRAQSSVDAAAHGAMVAFTRSEGDGEYARRVALAMLAEGGMAESEVTLGVYDFDTDTFTTSGERYNAFQIRVDASQALRKDLLIAPLLGMPIAARGGAITATAAIQPREIVFVIDQSGSMSFGAKIASAKEGILRSLDTVLDTDPNGVDHVALVGFGDAGFLHTGLTRLSSRYAALHSDWDYGINMCSVDPYVNYYAYYSGYNTKYAEGYNPFTHGVTTDLDSWLPMATGESFYIKDGLVDHSFRCCEPHCSRMLDNLDPHPGYGSIFWSWLDTYNHGNGVLWGLEAAADELELNGELGAHKVIIVLGDGADFCPYGYASSMPEPCRSNGDLMGATIDYAEDIYEDLNVHIYPIYYGTSSETRSYYTNLATGDGVMFNPNTPDELEHVFSKIVARSQIALVQ